MTDPTTLLSRHVRALRTEAGMSQQTLAVRAGLSIGVVTRLEQGRITDVQLSTAVALAKALGVSMDRLLAEDATEEE